MIIRYLVLSLSLGLSVFFLSACDSKPTVSVDGQAAAASAQVLLGQGDVKEGKALFAACQACHGASGEGNKALNAPALVKQSPWYLKRQLLAFKAGTRGQHPEDIFGQQMAAIAATIADETAVDALVAYIDKLPDSAPAATVVGDLKKGQDYYSMVCGSCHGPNAEGNVLLDAPALAGVDDWYLQRQFELFRKGIRGADDRYGWQMVIMAPALPTDDDVRNVVAYIQSLAE
jgi:cytochrome c553